MKLIVYRGGIAKFYLPSDWVEVYEPTGGGTFFGERPDAGTLRINAMDLDKPPDDPTNTAYDFLKKISNTSSIKNTSNGVAVGYSTQRTIESEKKLVLHTWQIGVQITPVHFRLIVFTYTILEAHEFDQNVQREIAMLEQSISEGEYPAKRGISGTY